MVYLKYIYDETGAMFLDSKNEPGDFDYNNEHRPASFTVWGQNISFNLAKDRLYLLCTKSISGMLGAKQVEDEAVPQNLSTYTMEKTEKHPTYFHGPNTTAPRTEAIQNSYGWRYQYKLNPNSVGDLYFCWGARGETDWHKVTVAYKTPSSVTNGEYFFSKKYKTLSHGESGKWVKYTSSDEQRLANMFSKVVYYTGRRDMLYKGLYQYYTAPVGSEGGPIGNYAFETPYGLYLAFTTDRVVYGQFKVDTTRLHVYQEKDDEGKDKEDTIVPATAIPYDTVTFPAEDEVQNRDLFFYGTIDFDTGVEKDVSAYIDNSLTPPPAQYRSTNIRVYENTVYEYNLPAHSFCVCYDFSQRVVDNGGINLTGASSSSGTFTTPPKTKYIRIVVSEIPNSNQYLRIQGYDNKFYINNKPYTILRNPSGSGELLGINNLTKKFADLADLCYGTYLVNLENANKQIRTKDAELSNVLGDLLKDGRWQDSNYVGGDEVRLYEDAYDMLKEISQPEITYEFTFLDSYGSNENLEYYEEDDVEWPDVMITDAAHLVDPEAHINCWAYIDKVNKCYDCPWKTTLEIDTKLTLASRHEFTDVLARIAEVAKETKSKAPIYERAQHINPDGSLPAQRLAGAIALNQTILNGAESSWHTDPNGNIIFESADGLTGHGLGKTAQPGMD